MVTARPPVFSTRRPYLPYRFGPIGEELQSVLAHHSIKAFAGERPGHRVPLCCQSHAQIRRKFERSRHFDIVGLASSPTTRPADPTRDAFLRARDDARTARHMEHILCGRAPRGVDDPSPGSRHWQAAPAGAGQPQGSTEPRRCMNFLSNLIGGNRRSVGYFVPDLSDFVAQLRSRPCEIHPAPMTITDAS